MIPINGRLDIELCTMDPFGPLRRGEIDILYDWLFIDEDDLATGPLLDRQNRMLAVAPNDPLARRPTISADELAGRAVPGFPDSFPTAMHDTLYPPLKPSGQPIPRTELARSFAEVMTLVASGLVVHLTVTSMASKLRREDIVLVSHPRPPAAPTRADLVSRTRGRPHSRPAKDGPDNRNSDAAPSVITDSSHWWHPNPGET